MGTRSRLAALGATLGAVVLFSGPLPAAASSEDEPADARDVVLTDLGAKWRLVEEQPGTLGAFTRTFHGPDGEVQIEGFPIQTPPGVHALFEGVATSTAGIEVRPEPTFELGVWLVPGGGDPGDGGFSALVVAAREHLFWISFSIATGSTTDGPALVLDVARRQVDAAGGEPAEIPPLEREVDDSELVPLLPAAPPPEYGFDGDSMTLAGPGAEELGLGPDDEVADFLTRRSKTVARAWADVGSGLAVGVGVTEYPFEIFAATALGVEKDEGWQPIGDGRVPGLPDAVTFVRPERSDVGVVFRRGDLLVTVLVSHRSPSGAADAIPLAIDMARSTAEGIPGGATQPYDPSPPSRFVGLALTVGIVIAAVAGSRAIALLRARRVRRRWAIDEPPVALPPPGTPTTRLVDLDADAAALRRRGWTFAAIQSLTVVVGVVALAGDFATTGMIVAVVSLLVGLGASRWWMGRELSLLGPAASPRAFVLPRLPGLALGLVTFAVLGVGVAYLLKGLRYLALPPTLAHLRWTDLLGISPRAVAVLFTLGGLVLTAFGAALYRVARALGRAGVRRVLAADPRPPALYLRSFADDSLPLPTIASARRPLFELFSIRGADPFEESVTWELDTYAPVVAVGRPGSRLQTLGAAREQLADDTWRHEVAAWMREAGLIVLAPGETVGLSWELAEIVRGDHLGKSIFVFPPLPPSDLRRRWQHTAGLLRDSGAAVGELAAPVGRVHTVRIEPRGGLVATVASTRDEATYRTAVDRAVEPDVVVAARPTPVAVGAGST